MQDMLTQLIQPAGLESVLQSPDNARNLRTAAVSASADTRTNGHGTSQTDVPADSLGRAVDRINYELQGANRGLRFSIDDQSGRIVVKVVNTDTDEVIRQIPSEEVLALARRARTGDGLIIDKLA
jgi:flagellar protein FlaG